MNAHHLAEALRGAVGDVVRGRPRRMVRRGGDPRHRRAASGARSSAASSATGPFLVANGDVATTLPLGRLLAARHEPGVVSALAVLPNGSPDRRHAALGRRDGRLVAVGGERPRRRDGPVALHGPPGRDARARRRAFRAGFAELAQGRPRAFRARPGRRLRPRPVPRRRTTGSGSTSARGAARRSGGGASLRLRSSPSLDPLQGLAVPGEDLDLRVRRRDADGRLAALSVREVDRAGRRLAERRERADVRTAEAERVGEVADRRAARVEAVEARARTRT